MARILIVTSENSIRKSLEVALKNNGIMTQSTKNSSETWRIMQKNEFDLVIIDFQLKSESGLSIYKTLRNTYLNIPILMMGEGKFDEFMLKDLSSIAYDYILRPFSSRDLYEKIVGMIQLVDTNDPLLTFGELRIDVRQRLVVVKDKFLQLGKLEFQILLLLVKKTGEVVDPKKIMTMIKAEGNLNPSSALCYVNRLRDKLHRLADGALEIAFIKGQGYQIVFGGGL